jgi:hypothetical protein
MIAEEIEPPRGYSLAAWMLPMDVLWDQSYSASAWTPERIHGLKNAHQGLAKKPFLLWPTACLHRQKACSALRRREGFTCIDVSPLSGKT